MFILFHINEPIPLIICVNIITNICKKKNPIQILMINYLDE